MGVFGLSYEGYCGGGVVSCRRGVVLHVVKWGLTRI